jgi:hypothetical protein
MNDDKSKSQLKRLEIQGEVPIEQWLDEQAQEFATFCVDKEMSKKFEEAAATIRARDERIGELEEALTAAFAYVSEPREKNKPIEKLLSEYASECCDFNNIEWVVSASQRYVQTMPDSQVRCFLYILAKALTAEGKKHG